MDDESFAPSAAAQGTGGMRGFGVAPAIVTDTLSLLTEIAVERAKAGAMRVLKQRFVEPICGTDDDTKTGVMLKNLLTTSGNDGRAFPRTCDVLQSLRLEDLLASGKALLTAVRDDLRHTLAPALIQKVVEDKLKLPPGAAQAVLAIANAAIDRGTFDGIAAQAAIEALRRAAWQYAMQSMYVFIEKPENAKKLSEAFGFKCKTKPDEQCNKQYKNEIIYYIDKMKKEDKISNSIEGIVSDITDEDSDASKLIGNACRARLAIAVIKRCSNGGCTATSVLKQLEEPTSAFPTDTQLPWKLCWIKVPNSEPPNSETQKYRKGTKTAEEVAQVVVQALELIAPVVDERGPERAKAAIRLVAKLISMANGDTAPRNLQAFTEIAVALVDEDYATALGRLIGILREEGSKNKSLRHLRKLSSLLGAVASYASVYRATKDADPEAARKQALESLIDGATDRTGREDEWITSIGSNVGFSFTATNRWLGLDDFEPGVRVPLGITTEYLPSSQGKVGVRLGAQLADLGQFVRRGTDEKVDEIEWADFLSPGVEAGLLLGRSVNLSLHVSYAPSVPKTMDTDGVWRVGLSLGYYVPFFDLN